MKAAWVVALVAAIVGGMFGARVGDADASLKNRTLKHQCDGRTMPRSVHIQVAKVAPKWANDPAFDDLLCRESNYGRDTLNDSSGACGWGQFLPCGKSVGPLKGCGLGPVRHQLRCMIAYTRSRYKTAANALAFHRQNGYY